VLRSVSCTSPEAQFLPEAVLSCDGPPRLSVAGRHVSHELCYSNLRLSLVYLTQSFRTSFNALFFFFLYELIQISWMVTGLGARLGLAKVFELACPKRL